MTNGANSTTGWCASLDEAGQRRPDNEVRGRPAGPSAVTGIAARVWSGIHVEVSDVDAVIVRPPQIPDAAPPAACAMRRQRAELTSIISNFMTRATSSRNRVLVVNHSFPADLATLR